MKALVAKHLSFAFPPDDPVVSDVTMTLEPGELVLLAGPNGSGKSTLLRLFGGLLKPGGGSVELFGHDAASMATRARARQVASVPQALVHLPDLRVRDFVFGGRYAHIGPGGRTTTEDHAAVNRALEEANVSAFGDRSLREVSGGQLGRILVARALAQEAPLVLFDEPTASLDPGHQVRLLALIRRLVDAGRTAVLATHELALAPQYADRVALLEGGRLRALDTPAEVLRPDVLTPIYGPSLTFATAPHGGSTPIVHPWPLAGPQSQTEERDAPPSPG